jgi:hypothetical protein
MLFALNAAGQKGTLIEFGWDYPDVSQMSTRLPLMQNTPFDGICFSIQRHILEAFDTLLKNTSYFRLEQLKNLQWGKYQSNFIILRGYGKLGGLWYDDNAWDTITANMANLSRAIANPGIRGILFDPEYYNPDPMYNPWTYSKKQYPDKSFNDVRAQVKIRGSQFITALQQYREDFSFLSIWLTSLVVEDLKVSPLEGTRHALLVPFFEGILEAKKETVKVIDGNEFGYWYKKPSLFLESGDYLRKNLEKLLKSRKAKAEVANVEIAQPVFYDGLLAKSPAFDKGLSPTAKWKWFEENIKYAMASTDDITWFYNQKINWWQEPVNDTLYQILENNKSVQRTNARLSNKPTKDGQLTGRVENINSGVGYLYSEAPKNPMQTGEAVFAYKLDQANKTLSFDFRDKIPASLCIYVNNTLVKDVSPASRKQDIALKKLVPGKYVMLVKYPDKTEASAIEVYN